jgi:hypothetical protein
MLQQMFLPLSTIVQLYNGGQIYSLFVEDVGISEENPAFTRY